MLPGPILLDDPLKPLIKMIKEPKFDDSDPDMDDVIDSDEELMIETNKAVG
jgi:hypothetical protein